jgi:transposase
MSDSPHLVEIEELTPESISALDQESLVKALRLQQETIKELRTRIEQLEEALARSAKNSSTSHKPPSSDITKAPQDNPASGVGEEKKRIGAQAGHPKHDREAFSSEAVDQTQAYGLPCCPSCEGQRIILLNEPPRVLQQVELKEILFQVQEHRAYGYYCDDCERVHYAEFPQEVVKEGLFKEGLTALVAYMKHVCHGSFSTIRKFIRDVVGIKVSRGYLSKLIQKVSASLDRPYEELLNHLPLELKLNVDETGHKANGERFWTWVFKAELYVLFRIDKSRGSEVLIDVLGKEFNGILGCDYFSAYRKYMKEFNVTVQFCIAHLIRDIRYLTTLPDEQTQAYGERLLEAVRELFKVIHHQQASTEVDFRCALEQAKATLLQVALQEVPSELDDNGKPLKRKANNLANRFRRHGQAYFEFITTPGIDPTNNLAEQAIRFIVIDRHVTQGTRSACGRKASERLWTVVATCSLQGRSAFEFIRKAIHAYWHDQPSPSLLPGST